jgi:hypothetical protein
MIGCALTTQAIVIAALLERAALTAMENRSAQFYPGDMRRHASLSECKRFVAPGSAAIYAAGTIRNVRAGPRGASRFTQKLQVKPRRVKARRPPMSRTLVRSLVVLLLSFASVATLAHDIWINRGSYRNPAGEWCCGAEDCGVVNPKAVHAMRGGYSVVGIVTYGEAITGNAADGPTVKEQVNEMIPYSQSLPSPDGAYWRCKRPDGSPRCFFAPPPGS